MKLQNKVFITIILIFSYMFIKESISANQVLKNENFRADIYGEGKTCFSGNVSYSFIKNPSIGENVYYNEYIEARKKILSEEKTRQASKLIPKITHHIWITNDENPREIGQEDLNYIKKSLDIANKEKGWKNIFWVNNRNLVPKTLAGLANYNLEIKEINEENLKNLANIKDAYLKSFDYNYALSSDILRYAILEEYGGLYLDVDYELKESANLEKLFEKYSFIVTEEKYRNRYVSNAFIGSIPQHPVLQESIAAVKKNLSNNPPLHLKLACHDKYFTLFATGPSMFTISFFKKANENKDLNDIFLAGNRKRYINLWPILSSSIGTHHVSNNWKQNTIQKIYPHCKKCVKHR